ncbi:hypothetical protein SOVF_124950 [Spinacia oleracea]|nr:hypothetical protein SOVF_124950 [Spinacia oleracea]
MDNKQMSGQGVMDRFPDDIIAQILIRLPVKSIHRFKCVSKVWNSIIKNGRFVSSYISLHGPSWVILDRMVRVDTKSNARVTQFDLQYPPEVSFFQIAPYQMADEPFLESVDGKHPSIMHCSNGVILFQFRTKRKPYEHET